MNLRRVIISALICTACTWAQSVPSARFEGTRQVQEPPPGLDSPEAVPEFRHRGFSREEIAGLSLPPHQSRVGANAGLPPRFVEQGQWSFNAAGQRYWHVRVRSDGAKGLRLHFTNFDVGSGKVWVHGVDGHVREHFGPYQQLGLLESGEFWTEFIFGDTVEVEFQAADASQQTVPFQIAELFHLWKDLIRPKAAVDDSCYVDANCGHLGQAFLSEEADSSVWLTFPDHTCSGTMVADRAHDNIPYLLTAGHCVTGSQDASALIAVFRYRSTGCGQAAVGITQQNQVSGATRLAWNVKEGADESIDVSVPDFALLRLSGLPNGSIQLAGWDPNPIGAGLVVYDFSYPNGEPMKYSDGQVIDASLSFFLQIGWHLGVTDRGSSGSGLFDSEEHLVGVDSAGPKASVCSLANPDGIFTRFSAIYNTLKPWIDPASTPPPPQVTFTANPNPIVLASGATTGQTTLSWNAPGHSHLVIRLKSSTGSAMTGTLGSSGSVKTGTWVNDGLQFFLVDADSQQSLASLTVHTKSSAGPPPSVTFTANPNPIVLTGSATSGQTTLSWNAPGHSKLVIRLKSATGSAMTGTVGTKGSTKTGTWVTDGLQFFLVDVNTGASLANLTVRVTGGSQPPPSNTLTFTANPNPIVLTGSATTGQTTLSWNAPGHSKLYITVNGSAMTGTLGSSGSTKTGTWVKDGMQFSLIDKDSGSVLASLVVRVTGGASQPVTFTADPNPIIMPAGVTTGETTLSWDAPGHSALEIHINSQVLVIIGNSFGSIPHIPAANGTVFSLLDSLTRAVLAKVTMTVGVQPIDDAIIGTYFPYQVRGNGIRVPELIDQNACDGQPFAFSAIYGLADSRVLSADFRGAPMVCG